MNTEGGSQASQTDAGDDLKVKLSVQVHFSLTHAGNMYRSVVLTQLPWFL